MNHISDLVFAEDKKNREISKASTLNHRRPNFRVDDQELRVLTAFDLL
jgi:hypothetical protein